jgi:hypothetical protein
VENQDRSTVTRSTFGWLVSPAFDLLLIVNVGWLLLLLPWFSSGTSTVIDFWQVYFITLPHRWITLVLVAFDPDRRGNQSPKLLGIAILFAIVVFGIYFGTQGLFCLAVVDFIWNAWHFAAQHSGILRMYGLKAGAPSSLIERWGLRLFVTYSILRTASWAAGWAAGDSQLESIVHLADLAMMMLPVLLILHFMASGIRSLPRAIYLASVISLYSGILLTTTFQMSQWLLPLLVGSAMFHATEYLAIVTIYANKRETVGTDGRFRMLTRHWLSFLVIYIVSLGTLGFSLELSGMNSIWFAINIWAALVHYAFDGMIWKLRITSTAQALGATA